MIRRRPMEGGEAQTASRFALVLLCCAACGGPQPTAQHSIVLSPPSSWGGNFVLRQRIHANFSGREADFEAVVQKSEDQLTMVGLTPFGTRAFVLEQLGTEVEFQSFVDRDLPFPPRYILSDVQRTFVHLPAATEEESGIREHDFGTDRMRDELSRGRLIDRQVSSTDETQTVHTSIEYEGGAREHQPPTKVRLVNHRYGYELELVTIDYQPLEPAARAAP